MVAIAGVLIGGIRRGAGLQRAVVREGTTGDHQPLLGSRAFALEPRLHPALDHLDLPLALSPRLAPSNVSTLSERSDWRQARHRLPRGLWATSTPCVRG